MARADRVLRPFWLHQAAEYLIGLVVVSMGLQSLQPAVPTIAGGLIIVNAAFVDGPLGAFRAFDRRIHRMLDVVVMAVLVIVAVLPWLDLDGSTRALLLAAAAVLAVVWWNSAFERKPKRDPAAKVDRSEAIGRSAGRMAGGVAKAVRDRSRSK